MTIDNNASILLLCTRCVKLHHDQPPMKPNNVNLKSQPVIHFIVKTELHRFFVDFQFMNCTLFNSLGYHCKSRGLINIITCWFLNDVDSFVVVRSISVFSLNAGPPLESNTVCLNLSGTLWITSQKSGLFFCDSAVIAHDSHTYKCPFRCVSRGMIVWI